MINCEEWVRLDRSSCVYGVRLRVRHGRHAHFLPALWGGSDLVSKVEAGKFNLIFQAQDLPGRLHLPNKDVDAASPSIYKSEIDRTIVKEKFGKQA